MTIYIIAAVLLVVCPIGFITYNEISDKNKNKKLENACQNQHLMFNQLSIGDYIWKIEDNYVKPYIIQDVGYSFNRENECDKIHFKIKGINTAVYTTSININDARSFKYLRYYTLYNEAKLTLDSIMSKRKKEIENIKTSTPKELNDQVGEVIKRLENLKTK